MNKIFRLACCFLFLTVCALPIGAQAVAPWFRGTAKSWQTLKTASFTPVKIAKIPLLRPMSGTVTGQKVKTTVPNWLAHRLSHSGTLNTLEKKLFRIHPNNPPSVVGKLTYLWDRDALLAQSAGTGEINTNAFSRRQELLQTTLAEVETHWLEEISEHVRSYAFPTEATLNLLADPSQPPAYVLSRQELEMFPAMTLAEQQAFVRYILADNTERLAALLAAEPDKLTSPQYANYYYLKLRRRYFTLLERVLNAAQTPRRTMIIRVRKQIPLSFLPQSESRLTDAQRLGKLHFYADRMLARGQAEISEQTVALQAEIARQEKLYGIYAQAEAFNIPYETVLDRPSMMSVYVLGQAEEERLTLLPHEQAAAELPELIRQAQTHKNAMLRQTPSDPDFYTRYFRLHLKESILKTRLTRARFFIKHSL